MLCYVKVIIPPYGSMVGNLGYIVYFCSCVCTVTDFSAAEKTAARNFARLFDYYLAWAYPILVNCWQSEFAAVWWDMRLGCKRTCLSARQLWVVKWTRVADTHYPYIYTGHMYGPYTVCILHARVSKSAPVYIWAVRVTHTIPELSLILYL